MLDAGQPVIIDFGIAHIADSTRLTKTGLVMGTPGYLAPEVIEGSPSSGGSDVHSWGATVAYAATGRQPFGSGTYQTIFFRVLEGKPDIAGIPPRLLPFVTAALSTDPQARPSARWLAGQLGMPRADTRMTVPGAAATRFDYPSTRTMAPPPAPMGSRPPAPLAGPPVRVAYRSPAEAARDVADLLPPVVPAPAPPRRQAAGRGPGGRTRAAGLAAAWARPAQPGGRGRRGRAQRAAPGGGHDHLARGDHPVAGRGPGAVPPRRTAQRARRTAERHRDRDRDRPVDRRPRGADHGLARAARDHGRAARRGGVGDLHQDGDAARRGQLGGGRRRRALLRWPRVARAAQAVAPDERDGRPQQRPP